MPINAENILTVRHAKSGLKAEFQKKAFFILCGYTKRLILKMG